MYTMAHLPYYTILYYTILYYTILYYTILYYTLLCTYHYSSNRVYGAMHKLLLGPFVLKGFTPTLSFDPRPFGYRGRLALLKRYVVTV